MLHWYSFLEWTNWIRVWSLWLEQFLLGDFIWENSGHSRCSTVCSPGTDCPWSFAVHHLGSLTKKDSGKRLWLWMPLPPKETTAYLSSIWWLLILFICIYIYIYISIYIYPYIHPYIYIYSFQGCSTYTYSISIYILQIHVYIYIYIHICVIHICI